MADNLGFINKKYVSSVKELSQELINLIDSYSKEKEINEEQLEKGIKYFSTQYSDIFYDQSEINVTIQRKLGTRRIFLLEKVLQSISAQK